MRTREVTIPLALWICAAICAHFLFGSGGLVVAKVHDDRAELWKLSREASSLAKQGEQTFEVAFGEPTSEPPAEVAPPPPPPPKPKTTPPAPPVASAKPVPPPEKPPSEKRIVMVEKKRDDEKKPVRPPEPLNDRRIAVRQHVKPNQDDNPTAKFIADEANRVQNETRATLTAHGRDDEKPEPGATHRSVESSPGDADQTKIADSEDRPGTKNRAPGEHSTDVDVQHEPKLAKPLPQPTAAAGPSSEPPGARADRPAAEAATPRLTDSPPQPAPGGATSASPDVIAGTEGGWTFNPARQGGAAAAAPATSSGSSGAVLPGGRMWTIAGLGQAGAPGALNTNLDQSAISSIVGSDNLRKLREADGERRKSQHRGSWVASNFDRWRSAIENYVSNVKEGNQTALNAARVPFATYLNGMHDRIHPIFAEGFLASLDSLPANHPLNDQELVTRLEIVLTRDGHLKRMGVVRLSGVTAFDVAALDSVDRAQPFGPAPSAIVSPDGNVYLHWEFHRNEVFACSTMGARPFILAAPPPGHEPSPAPPAPLGPPRPEAPAAPGDSRQGAAPPEAAGPRSQSTT